MRATTRTTAILLLTANLVFWICFWVDFSRRLVPYREHHAVFEQVLPMFVFHGKALPAAEQMTARPLRLAQQVQMPSFLAVRPVVYTLNQKPSAWEETYWGISPWGYLLIVITFLSFLQWYLVARLIGWVVSRVWPGHHYDVTDPRVRRSLR